VIQKFLPEVAQGDKRIILVDGEALGAVNRVPVGDDIRSNMVRGGAAKQTELTAREQEICTRIGPDLKRRGLLFVGIDVIDGHLTEINVTSPTGLRIIKRLGIDRELDQVVGVGPTMLAGIGLVALALVVMLGVTSEADRLAREDLAFALSVVLLGMLMMVTRRNAVGLVVGFMSLENGLVLAATGAKGMPLVVEISVAFSVLIAFIVIGIFLFRIRERFETVDVTVLDRFRGGQQ